MLKGLTSSLVALVAETEALEKRVRERARGRDLERHRDDPVGYARDILGVELTEAQQQIAHALVSGTNRVLVPAGHNVGKSFLAAVLVSWWFDTRPSRSAVITTAPTAKHVRDVLWREVRSQRKRAGLGGFTGQRLPELYDGPEHYAAGYTADSGEAWAGRHLRYMLFIFDEAVGVGPAFWEVTKTMFQSGGEHAWLAIANPTDTSSQMYLEESAAGLDGTPLWQLIRLSAAEHPNVVRGLAGLPPKVHGAVTLSQFEEWVSDWTDPEPAEDVTPASFEWPPQSGRYYRTSPEFDARALGRWPSAAAFGVWSQLAWDLACEAQELPGLDTLPEIGCDVAHFGPDYTVIVVRVGPCVVHCERHNGWDGPQVVGRLKELAKEWAGWATRRLPSGHDPLPTKCVRVKVDEDGIGGMGVVDWANPTWREDFTFIGVSAAATALQPDRYHRRRDELWFRTVELAKKGLVDLSRLATGDKRLFTLARQQAFAPLWKLTPAGQRAVEPKQHMRERLPGVGSPDVMDALNLAFADAATPAPIIITHARKPVQERESLAAKKGLFGRRQ